MIFQSDRLTSVPEAPTVPNFKKRFENIICNSEENFIRIFKPYFMQHVRRSTIHALYLTPALA
jgi:hypothetical protein